MLRTNITSVIKPLGTVDVLFSKINQQPRRLMTELA